MKKNRIFLWGMAALVLALSCALVLGSCGADPKGLAKQSYELTQQALQAGTDLNKAAALQQKAAAIAEKVLKLSDSDRVIYTQELARLTGQGLGEFINTTSDFLNTFSDSFNATTNLFNDNSVQDTQDTLDTQDALKTTEQALDVAKKALDLLNVLGD
jgi:hypothetical protein